MKNIKLNNAEIKSNAEYSFRRVTRVVKMNTQKCYVYRLNV